MLWWFAYSRARHPSADVSSHSFFVNNGGGAGSSDLLCRRDGRGRTLNKLPMTERIMIAAMETTTLFWLLVSALVRYVKGIGVVGSGKG